MPDGRDENVQVPNAGPGSKRQRGNRAGLRRRSFLARSCQTAAALFLPVSVRTAIAGPPTSTAPDFHFHPHYRQQTPFDATLLQINPLSDQFVTEKYHAAIAPILDAWSARLLESSHDISALEGVLTGSFTGTSWAPLESRPLRPASTALEVRELRFPSAPTLNSAAFLTDLQSSLHSFSRILTAEFQVTNIDCSSAQVTTLVRYELVGAGQGFFREQRVGHWSLDWERSAQDTYRITRWRAHEEIRSRSSEICFSDITLPAFGANSSYSAQMLHGADYWRTLIDAASGIDIYGHNGISVGDVDGDGLDDIYVCQPAGLPNRLYRNRGDGTFEDITETSGVGLLDNTACALIADFDNDGRQDLVVVRADGPLLFLNQGGGHFQLKPGAFRFANPPQGTFTGAAAADYDRDGWLDIYFCLYAYYRGAGQYRYPTPYFAAENGPPNFLMRNNGDGTFRDVTAQCGLDKNNTRFSFCCGWGDYNQDGWPDLYVVNDFGRKNLYRNNGNGTFTDVAVDSAVEDIGAGMSVCWLDYNSDGAEDLYVANMWTAAGERITNDNAFQKTAPKQVHALYRKHAMGNSLFRNNGNSGFENATESSRTAMGRWSWSSDAWDFDHDGYPDLYIANGMISGTLTPDLNSFFWRQVIANSPSTARPDENYEQAWDAINELVRSDYSWSGFERNVLYANNRDGTFSDVSGASGLDFIEDSRAFALSDFDGDGRQELLLKNRKAPQLRLIKNTIRDLSPAIAFRLRGTKSNHDAIGAAIIIESDGARQTKLLQAGSGFLSQHSKDMFFGLGKSSGNVSATIRWPSGLVQTLKDLPPGCRIDVTEGASLPSIKNFRPQPTPTARPAPALSVPSTAERLPDKAETWLLVPIPALDFSCTHPNGRTWTLSALRGRPVLVTVTDEPAYGSTPPFLTLPTSHDAAVSYSLLFRHIFDRHRDLLLPTSFLIDEDGNIVKVYQGRVDLNLIDTDFRNLPRTGSARLAKALPFPGVSTSFEFDRNYLSLGSIFFRRGYIDSAAIFFQSALKDDPASAEAFYGMGSVYLQQQKTADARDCFERAANLKSNYPETTANAWNNLGLLAARDGYTKAAITYLDKALQVDPDHFIALENLGNAYRQERLWDDARNALEHALAIKPADPEANYSLGMVFAQTDDTARAYDYLQKALRARPDYPEALNNLGVLYLRTHRRDEAVAAFQQCIRVAPGFNQSYLNLARVYTIEGETEKARTTLLALLKEHPNDALAQKALSELH